MPSSQPCRFGPETGIIASKGHQMTPDETDDKPKAPRMPRGLGASGRRLWREITDPETGWTLRPDEERMLEDAARQADLIDRLESALATADLVVKGSMGQPAPSPLLTEIRQHRTVLANLLGKLKLTEPEDDESEDHGRAARYTRSESARIAARARWGTR